MAIQKRVWNKAIVLIIFSIFVLTKIWFEKYRPWVGYYTLRKKTKKTQIRVWPRHEDVSEIRSQKTHLHKHNKGKWVNTNEIERCLFSDNCDHIPKLHSHQQKSHLGSKDTTWSLLQLLRKHKQPKIANLSTFVPNTNQISTNEIKSNNQSSVLLESEDSLKYFRFSYEMIS